MLDWSNRLTKSEENTALLRSFITEIIEPRLTWHAGRSAESIRTMCVQVLCSVGEGAPMEAYELFPDLTEYFISLCDDNNAVTRALTLRCLLKCGPIGYDNYKPLVTGD